MSESRAFCCLSCILLFVLGVNVPAGFSREYHERFDVQQGAKLYLRHGDGDVTITTWERDELKVDVYYRVPGETEDDKLFYVDFDRRGQKIYITGKAYHDLWRRTLEYRYEISAPGYLLLDLKGDDGKVAVSGWRSDLKIDLSDGNVDLNDIRAEMVEIDLEDGDLVVRRLEGEISVNCEDGNVTLEKIRTPFADIGNQDGSVEITDAAGSFRISLEDGNCRISGMTAEELDIRAQDGNVDIQLEGVRAPRVRAVCGDGNIELEMPADTDAELQINARRSSTRTKLAHARIEKDEKHYFRAVLGSGAGSINLSAGDGRITVRQ